MATTRNKRTRQARAELRAWYLHRLLPKLARAAKTGVVNPGAVEALDADLRAMLEIAQERKEAA
jgi:uncharacterized protein YciW